MQISVSCSYIDIDDEWIYIILFVAALGIANALVWPAVWPYLEGLGKHTKTASALLIMAIAGGAIILPLYGRLVDKGRKINSIGFSITDAWQPAQELLYSDTMLSHHIWLCSICKDSVINN